MNTPRSVATLVTALLLSTALPNAPAIAAAEEVVFAGDAAPGTIVVRTSERRLYLVLGQGRALRYPVGVGRAGWQWQGTSAIDGKYLNPNWAPPAAIRLEQPNLPALIPAGSPANPMGVAAMTLAGGAYAIHGTNTPKLIGGFVSHGCIRMFNADITDLYARVGVGTIVVVGR
jgi:lipoprotein-anchoring transpeptidase ErfK/SrfK